MPVFAVQCPNCGSPVDPNEAVKGRLVCKSCGSFLEIVTGPSGFPMAHLLAIEEDTNYLAKAQTAERLKAQIAELEAQYAKIMQKLNTPFDAATAEAYFAVIFIGVIIGLFIDFQTPDTDAVFVFLVPLVLFFVTAISQDRSQKQHEDDLKKAKKEVRPSVNIHPAGNYRKARAACQD